ncbi:hypothetical protein M8C21_013428, partial [Ambrosia artemisiifolia]
SSFLFSLFLLFSGGRRTGYSGFRCLSVNREEVVALSLHLDTAMSWPLLTDNRRRRRWSDCMLRIAVKLTSDVIEIVVVAAGFDYRTLGGSDKQLTLCNRCKTKLIVLTLAIFVVRL